MKITLLILFLGLTQTRRLRDEAQNCLTRHHNQCYLCQNSFANFFRNCQSIEGVPNSNCFFTSEYGCLVCDEGYVNDSSDLTCKKEEIPIENCSLLIFNGNCFACNNGKIPSDDLSECIKPDEDDIDPNCLVTTIFDTDLYNVCYECKPDYTYSMRDLKCIKNKEHISNCRYLLNEDICLQCKTDYHMIEGQSCVKNDSQFVNFLKNVRVFNSSSNEVKSTINSSKAIKKLYEMNPINTLHK